ncbi:hypothetical protein [Leucobacter sp. OH1287]|uniref:HK97 gp10 family phage protein n=1 Tax=Leucobacter sp. OH1287 TaxID=2491049 RepID=UPI000F5E164E|nr:hypothetical protein [Leucobacter sp. OH1287]RRD61632.1 hypothetical protein EII30_02050 [Leucobacter sp. OH1287]
MSKPEVRLSDDFFRQVGLSGAMRQAVMAEAEGVAAAARAIAPVDTGAYRDGIKAKPRKSKRRWVGRVEFEDGKSTLVEARSGVAQKALAFQRGGK